MASIPKDMKELTITEVMREPIVAYHVVGYFDGCEEAQPFDDEATAADAARMMESGGATEVTVERRTLRVVEDKEELAWRAEQAWWAAYGETEEQAAERVRNIDTLRGRQANRIHELKTALEETLIYLGGDQRMSVVDLQQRIKALLEEPEDEE